jgi:hypothetical protein
MSLWLGIFLFLQSPVAAQVNQVRRVLILDDIGNISSPGFAEVGQAIFLGLQQSPYQIELLSRESSSHLVCRQNFARSLS